jgi:cohesin loading factor subunit SCC2
MHASQVQHGLTIDLLGSMRSEASSNNEWQVSGMDLQLMTSLDVGLCQLIIMSTADIDRRVLSEETIDNCIQLLNNAVRRLILPCIDTSFATTVSLPSANAAHEADDEEPQKLSSTGRRVPSQQRVNLRSNKTLRKVIERVLPVVCEFMDHLAQLLQAVKLADRWVLHFSTAMVEFFLLEHSSFATSLQQSGLLVLRSVFVNYKDHRALVMEEVVNAMMKLPTAKRNLRTVKLLNSKEYIQRISTVVVALVQSCTSAASIEALDESAHREASGAQVDSSADASSSLAEETKKLTSSVLEEARESARLFIGPLMKECFKKNDDRDNRAVLDNFVEDMLTMFVRPEWAGAEILLEVVSSSLASILSGSSSKDARKAESQLSLTALTLVGKICSAIKIQQNAVNHDKIADDVDAQATIEDYSRVLSLAGVIVKKETSQDEAKDENNCDMVVLKHIVIAYLRRGSRTEMIQVDSKRLLLLQFMLDSLNGGDINERSVIEAEAKHWQSLWGVTKSSVDTKSKVAPPSTELGLRLSLRLVVTRDFCALFDKLLAHVMALLSNGIPSFRARVMKALAGIVDVDPMLMAEGGMRGAVQRCFLDERTSVRQAAVDLVGKYVMVQPALVRALLLTHCTVVS